MTALDVEVRHVRESVRDVLKGESTLDVVRAAIDDDARWRELWRLAVDLGWNGLAVPEACGGLGFGVSVQASILEEAGYAIFAGPFVSTTIATCALSAAEPGAARDGPLSAIAEGAVATLAVGGPPGTVVDHVPDGARATIVVLVTGREVLVVERAGEAFGGPGPDPNRPLCSLRLDGPATELDGVEPAAVLRAARVLQAAELVGVAARALDVAVAHARERRQFGRAIGEFQGVKHRLADCYVRIERARSLVAAAAAEIDAHTADAEVEALSRMAKAAASEAAMTGVRDAIQVLGALGITAECELPWLLRRARVGAQLHGDARHHYAWIGRRRIEEAR